MLHYIASTFFKVFRNNKDFELQRIHHVADGWAAVGKCNINQKQYLMTVRPIQSEILVCPDTPEKLIERGGL